MNNLVEWMKKKNVVTGKATKNTLAFGCPHLPFEHKDFFSFINRIYKYEKCDRIVCLGDIVDNHSISYHEHSPDGWSPKDEMEEVDKHLRVWFKQYPKMYLTRGNHDRLVDRKGKTVGLPNRCFKTFREMWNLPDGWKEDFKFTLDNVVYEHGTGYSGDLSHLKAARNNAMSTVIAHTHHNFGVAGTANETSFIMGVSVGCGIDRHRYAFEYGRDFCKKPILGCVVVHNSDKGISATPYPMFMG